VDLSACMESYDDVSKPFEKMIKELKTENTELKSIEQKATNDKEEIEAKFEKLFAEHAEMKKSIASDHKR